MSELTGLGPLETATIRAVARRSGPSFEYVRCADVLDALENDGLGANYLYRVVQDLTVPWRLHLPLLDGQGNFGGPGSDPAADAGYTEVRLSPVGRLALESGQGEVGPLPLGLIEGTLYRGGRIPPFDPLLVVDAVTRLQDDGPDSVTDDDLDLLVGPPSLPTGGTVDGDLAALYRGEPAEMRMSCRIALLQRQGRHVLEITGFPLGVDVDVMIQCIAQRASHPTPLRGGGHQYVADVQDLSSGRSGIRMHVILRNNVDPAEAEQWLRTIWPVSIDQTWALTAPMADRLRAAAQVSGPEHTGLPRLRALL